MPGDKQPGIFDNRIFISELVVFQNLKFDSAVLTASVRSFVAGNRFFTAIAHCFQFGLIYAEFFHDVSFNGFSALGGEFFVFCCISLTVGVTFNLNYQIWIVSFSLKLHPGSHLRL